MISRLSEQIPSPIPDVREPLWEREPLWIPGTDYRPDCGVGQLRPTGMRPCSAEPPRLGNRWPERGRLNGRERLCQQHQCPTSRQSNVRADQCNHQAMVAFELARATTCEWDRNQHLASARWFVKRTHEFRSAHYDGLTSDLAPPCVATLIEWQGRTINRIKLQTAGHTVGVSEPAFTATN